MISTNAPRLRLVRGGDQRSDEVTGIWRRGIRRPVEELFPAPLTSEEILDIVDDLTESLTDWYD